MRKVFESIFRAAQSKILRGLPSRPIGKNQKGDIIKYFDKHIENLIISSLKKNIKFRAQIISEEIDKPFIMNPKAKTELYYIIIDPVDGSDNYLAGTHFAALAIAVFDENLEPVYSLAGNYYSGDYIYADKKAAYFNDKKFKKPFIGPARELLMLTVSKTKLKKPSNLLALINAFDIVRSFGATVGEMIYVAKGEAKAFVDIRGRLTLENFAPFFLIARHLGLKMTDEKGKDMKLKSLSMKKGYKMVFSQPKFLKKIIKYTGVM